MEKNKNEDESGRRRIYKKITQQENADQPSPYRQKVSGKVRLVPFNFPILLSYITFKYCFHS